MQLTTGETRRYDAATGAFQAPRPFIPFTSAGGRGAWEWRCATRTSTWTTTPASPARPPLPAPGTPPIGVNIGQDLDIYALRTQYSF
jgi:hypothetical protein